MIGIVILLLNQSVCLYWHIYEKSVRLKGVVKGKLDNRVNEQDIEALIAMIDEYNESGGSRLKVNVVEGEGAIVDKKYHHGRCDVGSPWAAGRAFDVLE